MTRNPQDFEGPLQYFPRNLVPQDAIFTVFLYPIVHHFYGNCDSLLFKPGSGHRAMSERTCGPETQGNFLFTSQKKLPYFLILGSEFSVNEWPEPQSHPQGFKRESVIHFHLLFLFFCRSHRQQASSFISVKS